MSSAMSNLLSACASLAGSLVLIRTLAKEIPDPVWSYLDSGIRYLFTPNSNQQTIVIDQHCCGFSFSPNQIYDAAEIYLRDKISPSTKRFKVTQPPKQKNLNVAIEKSQELFDKYENINLKWRLVTVDSQSQLLVGQPAVEKRSLELRFHKKFKDRVLDDYLPSVLKKSEEIKDGNKVVKLYTPSGGQVPGLGGGAWGSIILDHPATFDTLAMEQEMKKMIVDDLDRFVKRLGLTR
ncbi:AAA-ATPase At2g18193-like [Cornus florida]|uniref:AAA-ATPase At2g18193-like n=1 Tax=Cornus florida TaxID=4283 RepID=UPI0028A1CB6B|nr:AAA-ATPase At2g18193-like [Cornus florida]